MSLCSGLLLSTITTTAAATTRAAIRITTMPSGRLLTSTPHPRHPHHLLHHPPSHTITKLAVMDRFRASLIPSAHHSLACLTQSRTRNWLVLLRRKSTKRLNDELEYAASCRKIIKLFPALLCFCRNKLKRTWRSIVLGIG